MAALLAALRQIVADMRISPVRWRPQVLGCWVQPPELREERRLSPEEFAEMLSS
jgi:hypothetical protein